MLRKNIPHFPIWKSTPIYINDPFMKIDGAGIEFGIRDKVFYMITSRSDIITKSSDFIEYGKQNFPDDTKRMKRCYHYAEVFEILQDIMKDIKYDCRFRSEIQYVPMAEHNNPAEDVITFVNIPYYKKHLGSKLTVWLLDDYRWPLEIIEKNNSEVKFLSTTLIPYKVNNTADILKMYENTLKIFSPSPEGIVFTFNGKKYKSTFDQFKIKIRKS